MMTQDSAAEARNSHSREASQFVFYRKSANAMRVIATASRHLHVEEASRRGLPASSSAIFTPPRCCAKLAMPLIRWPMLIIRHLAIELVAKFLAVFHRQAANASKIMPPQNASASSLD